jgi:hypothetical protein
VLDQIQAHASQFLGVVGRPQLHLPDHLPFFFQHREKFHEFAIQEFRLQGDELFVHKLIDHLQDDLHFFRDLKIHRFHPFPFPSERCIFQAPIYPRVKMDGCGYR